jgi:hypothetical protein
MLSDKLGRIAFPFVLSMSYSSLVVFPIAFTGLQVFKPCFTTFMSSLVFPCDTEGSFDVFSDSRNLALALMLAVIEGFFMQQLVIIGGLGNLIPLSCVLSLRNYLLEALSDSRTRYQIYSSTKTFVIVNIAIKILKYIRSGKNVLTGSTIRMWRIHQTYNSLLNACLRDAIFPVLVSGWSVLIIIGTYTGLRLYGIVPLAIYILFVALAMDGLFAGMLTFKLSGELDKKSSELLGKWNSMLNDTKRGSTVIRKEVKSCVPLRVKLYYSNYFEVGTPLVIIDLCVERIVALLIAS